MEVPLVDKDYLLERTPGNGGWTYAPIPDCLLYTSDAADEL